MYRSLLTRPIPPYASPLGTHTQCCNLCFCAGGPVACHTGRTKRRREGAAQHKALAAAARAAGPATGPGPGVALLPFGAAAAGLLIPGDPTLASFLMSPAQQHDRGLGGGAAGGAAPPGYPPNASAGADLTQAIQVTAARALIACAPAALGGAANPTVVTAANAAAAAYSVTLMSCFVAPHAVAQHAPPAGATAAGPTAPGSDLSRWYADMALFQQRQQLAPHNAHAAAALMRRPQPPAAAVAVAAPGGAGLMNGTVETTGMAPYKNGDGNGNGNGTAGAPVANGDAHTLH